MKQALKRIASVFSRKRASAAKVEDAVYECGRGDEQSGTIESLVVAPAREEYVFNKDGTSTVEVCSLTEAIAYLRAMQRDHASHHMAWCGTPNPGQKPYLYGAEETCRALGIPEDPTEE